MTRRPLGEQVWAATIDLDDTLYRHFPAEEDLVAAIVDDSVEHMAARTEAALDAVLAGAPAGPELAALFADIARRHGTDRAVKAAAGRLDVEPAPGTAVDRAVVAITTLLDRAQAQGSVRDDVTFADLVLLLSTVPDAGTDAARRERWIEIVIAGLAPSTAP